MSDTPTNDAVTVQLGANGAFTWASLEEVEAWVNKQKLFYGKLDLRTVSDNVCNSVKGRLDSAFSEISNALNLAKSRPQAEPFRQRTSGVVAAITAHFGKACIPAVESASAKLIDKFFASKQPMLAAYALAYYIGVQFQHFAPAGLVGLFEAVLAELGIAGDTEVTARLKELQAEFAATLDSAKHAASQQQGALYAQLAQQRLAGEQQRQALDAAMQAATTKLQEHVTAAEARLAERLTVADDRLSAVEKTYDEKLALQSAVTYWESKAKGHRRWAIVWAVAAVLTGAGATWFMNAHLKTTLGETRVMDAQLWQVSKLAILAIFGVWLMRVVVRLMLSHTHLLTDATERRTMMLTYLAMMRESQLPEGQSRDLILQALFRPTSTGIVKDDASPPFMAEWLRATVGKD